MQSRTQLSRSWRRPAGLAAVASTMLGACVNPTASAEPTWGPWLFITAALAVVAGLALALGRMTARLEHSKAQASQAAEWAGLSRQHQAWMQCLGDQAWHSDSQHHPVEGLTGTPSAWAKHPAVTPVLEKQQPFSALAVETEDQAGNRLKWLIRGQPLQDQGGRFIGFVGTAQAEPAADASPAPAAVAAAAAAAQATDESDSFSFTVSHDLRAPIRVVEGFTRIVKEDYGHLLDRVGNDHLERVLGAAARMNLMIDALLNLARLSRQPMTQQPVNLSQLAHYVVDELRRAQPDREIDIQIQEDMLAHGDPTLLRLVLENLIGNAWKYSARTAQAQIAVQALQHGERTTYVVRDNGAGFDMRAAERLFGLFQRLHSASEFAGHGVGLASVRRIVQRHGGDIWAEAEPARGATFSFTLGP